MNERRINELAMQAGGIWRGGHVEQPNGDSVYTEQKSVDLVDMDLNKFTRLVVRECARALDDKLANPNGASVAYCDGSDLLEHFGVEE